MRFISGNSQEYNCKYSKSGNSQEYNGNTQKVFKESFLCTRYWGYNVNKTKSVFTWNSYSGRRGKTNLKKKENTKCHHWGLKY